MKKPVIGISSSIIIDSGGMFPGYERAYVNKDYVEAILNAGGIPFIIPISSDLEVIKSQIELIDGLILSGGHDVYPLNYGEEPDPKIGGVFPERDEFDFNLLKFAKEKNIPVLGICRGLQIINTYEGGTLYQDNSYKGKVLKHSQNEKPSLKTHTVEIDKNSKLFEIFEKETFLINSFHHQSVKDVAPTLKGVAYAKDGIVEAIEHKEYDFLIGVQWHPEMLFRNCDMARKLFKKFIEKANK